MIRDAKVVVITGGNSGIGLATALEFKALGVKVVVTGRNPDTLDDPFSTVREIHGGSIIFATLYFDQVGPAVADQDARQGASAA